MDLNIDSSKRSKAVSLVGFLRRRRICVRKDNHESDSMFDRYADAGILVMLNSP